MGNRAAPPFLCCRHIARERRWRAIVTGAGINCPETCERWRGCSRRPYDRLAPRDTRLMRAQPSEASDQRSRVVPSSLSISNPSGLGPFCIWWVLPKSRASSSVEGPKKCSPAHSPEALSLILSGCCSSVMRNPFPLHCTHGARATDRQQSSAFISPVPASSLNDRNCRHRLAHRLRQLGERIQLPRFGERRAGDTLQGFGA